MHTAGIPCCRRPDRCCYMDSCRRAKGTRCSRAQQWPVQYCIQSYAWLPIARNSFRKRRQQYRRAQQVKQDTCPPTPSSLLFTQANKGNQGKRPPARSSRGSRECYTCGSTEHLASDCSENRGESVGRPIAQHRSSGPRTKVVTTEAEENPLDLLYSSKSDDQSARMISVQDKGGRPKYAHVTIEGAPSLGIIDTGSDITSSSLP